MNKDTLYYDGACPICSAEIDKLSQYSRGQLVLKDIHQIGADEDAPDKDVLLSRLHLKTGDGQWVTGLKANIRAWHHTPFRHFWKFLDWPLVRPISHGCYEFWLLRRNRSS